jgi:hypothetical protein
MKHWLNQNYKTLIIAAFLIPIITVAVVSISHVTKWYGISNPISWAVYLSIGIEIAALSALAAISANMGKKVYFPFIVVTIIQFIGNIYFSYSYIDINSVSFKDWVDLVSPLTELMGIEPIDLVGNKRFLAFFAGGMLPIISLSFLHMLVKFTEEDRVKENLEEKQITSNPEDLKNFVDETVRVRLSEDDLKKLEEVLLNPSKPNEELKKAAEEYKKRGELLAEIIKNDEEMGLYDDTSDWDVTLMDGLEDEEPFFTEEEIEKILQEEPTEEEIQQNFSIIERETENILQEEKEVKFEEDNQRMDIIGQNGNEGLHYENEPPPPPSPLLKPKLQEHKPKFVEYVNPNASENDEEKKNL